MDYASAETSNSSRAVEYTFLVTVFGTATKTLTSPKPRPAYKDFVTLWKDADPDIPVLIAAKSEYANLHLDVHNL
jgi:hypothetical protein